MIKPFKSLDEIRAEMVAADPEAYSKVEARATYVVDCPHCGHANNVGAEIPPHINCACGAILLIKNGDGG